MARRREIVGAGKFGPERFRSLGVGQRSAVDLSWKADGACRWVEPELFYPVSDADAAPAKIVCSSCAVQQRCLEFALDSREFEGVWGGLTGTERRALHRRRRALTA